MLGISQLIRHSEAERTVLDIVLLSALWCTLIIQSFAVPRFGIGGILFGAELSGVTLLSIFSVNLAYPSYNGSRDFLFHSFVSSQIMSSGRIPTGTIYSIFPFLHLLTASVADSTGLPAATSLALVVGLALVGSLPVVYLFASRITASPRIGFLAMTILASSADFQLWGKYAAPTSLGFCYFLFGLAFLLAARARAKMRFMAIFFLVAVLLTHVLAAALLLVALVLVIAAARFRWDKSKRRATIGSGFAVLAGTIIIGYWTVTALVLQTYAPLLAGAFSEGLTLPNVTDRPGLTAAFLNSAQLVVLTPLYVLALLVVSRHVAGRLDSAMQAVVVSSLLFLGASTPLVFSSRFISGFGIAAYRWGLYGLPFAGLLISIFLVHQTRKAFVILIVFVLFGASLGTVASSFDINSPLLGSQVGRDRDYFSNTEVSAYIFVEDHFQDKVATDFIFASLFQFGNRGGVAVTYSDINLTFSSFPKVIRTLELQDRGLKVVASEGQIATNVMLLPPGSLDPQLSGGNLVYDNGEVVVVTPFSAS